MTLEPTDAEDGDVLRVRANKLDLLERLADDLAHEIKNPLHSMVINLEVLKRRVARVAGESDDLQRYFGVLSGELERVNRRIELLLRLSRPGRGAETTTLRDLVEELMELITLEARHREARVDFQPGDGAPRVFVPREPARQVILNLVLDALDATGPGATLRLVLDEADGSARLAVETEGGDAGEASPESPARLAVARHLAERMGARVDGEGEGARVLTVPLAG
ncbi:MAG TPA: HAMP domain-containing sensor histidine kinase [Longimicrobium sp.]|jgi:signal transduction histidine kinase